MQGVLEDALATVLRQPAVPLTVAGRTDSGVHAIGQVAHADIPDATWAAEADVLVRRLNGVLTPDVRVRAVRAVPPQFDARFAATWRRYEYRIVDDPALLDPRRRGFVLAWPRPLDVPAMAAAAAGVLGLHDFAAFCRRREGASTIRALHRLDVVRATVGIVAVVEADAFCHSMVRSLVGALIAVGEGRRDVDWPRVATGRRRTLERRPRRAGARPHPGRGRLPARRPAGGPSRADPRPPRLTQAGASRYPTMAARRR